MRVLFSDVLVSVKVQVFDVRNSWFRLNIESKNSGVLEIQGARRHAHGQQLLTPQACGQLAISTPGATPASGAADKVGCGGVDVDVESFIACSCTSVFSYSSFLVPCHLLGGLK